MSATRDPLQFTGENVDEEIRSFIEKYPNGDKELPKISKNAIEAVYAFGYGFYENGKYESAMHFFRFLTLADSQNRKYWMGLGAAYQMLKDHERALQSYGYAALLNENEPTAHFHAAECFFALKNREQGNEALTSAKTVALRKPKKYKTLLKRIALIKENPTE
ncbi:MAG: Chaperone protein IpgC [Chlamydiae bacterium]|nr:Chaperone protein IpgC [Chlamydiota bacterium]